MLTRKIKKTHSHPMRNSLKLLIMASLCLILAIPKSYAADVNLTSFRGLVEDVDHEQVSDYIDEFFRNR